ncbi:RCC1/BLIP-II [Ramicandelaber brevisporus]|nr:RCC1/BLIP-II [Ramicandelaber brevisporus]
MEWLAALGSKRRLSNDANGSSIGNDSGFKTPTSVNTNGSTARLLLSPSKRSPNKGAELVIADVDRHSKRTRGNGTAMYNGYNSGSGSGSSSGNGGHEGPLILRPPSRASLGPLRKPSGFGYGTIRNVSSSRLRRHSSFQSSSALSASSSSFSSFSSSSSKAAPGEWKVSVQPEQLNLPVPGIRSDAGHVLVVGSNECGQLGLGDEITERKYPFPLKCLFDQQIVDIAAGGIHNLALTANGVIWSWGCNDQKALGREGEEMIPAPITSGLDGVKIVKAYCGDSISVALSDEGKVYTWGTYRSSEGILGFDAENEIQAIPTIVQDLIFQQVVDVAVGTDHVLALTSKGEVYGWGNGQNYQIGRRIVERRKINGTRPERLALREIVKIGAGAYHSFAIDKSGNVYAWGLNNYGQCGVSAADGGIEDTIRAPTLISRLCGQNIKHITGGEHHSLALLEDGSVMAFGRSDNNQLGLPFKSLTRATPVDDEDFIHPEHKIPNADIDPEPDVSEGPVTKTRIRVPIKLVGVPTFAAIACGAQFSLGLTLDGAAYSWGSAIGNVLANGDEDTDVERPEPMKGERLNSYTIARIDAGGAHSILLAVSK